MSIDFFPSPDEVFTKEEAYSFVYKTLKLASSRSSKTSSLSDVAVVVGFYDNLEEIVLIIRSDEGLKEYTKNAFELSFDVVEED